MLESIGLAPAEAMTYRSLLRSAASLGELAHRLGMSILEVRVALHGLESKGLVGRVPGVDHRFRAATPPAGAQRRRHHDLRPTRPEAAPMAAEHRSAGERGGEHVQVLSGSPAAHAMRLVAASKVQVAAIVTDDVTELTACSRASLPTGVRELTIYPRSALSHADSRKEVESAVTAGAHIRVVDRPPFALLVVDRSLAFVAASADGGPADGSSSAAGPACSAVVVHSGGLRDSLVAVFDRTWEIAEPVRLNGSGLVALDEAKTVPSQSDLRLLALLLDGYTDEAIAMKLGLGTRTVQRRVHELIEAAGVRTRLQMVWQATRRGWI